MSDHLAHTERHGECRSLCNHRARPRSHVSWLQHPLTHIYHTCCMTVPSTFSASQIPHHDERHSGIPRPRLGGWCYRVHCRSRSMRVGLVSLDNGRFGWQLRGLGVTASVILSKLISSRWRKKADYLLLRDVWVIPLGNRITALLLAMIFLEGGLWVIVVRMSRDKWKSPHRF